MALFDLIQAAMGRPDPNQQLASMLGQGPGQPGSPGGPQPAAPGGPAGPAGGAAGPGGPGAAGGGAAGPQAPPQPQAYQSPPDLTSMYMQLAQRQQANEQFNRGLGLLAASTYPGRHPEMIMNAMTGATQDPGALINNVVKLQMLQQQQQRLAATQNAIPGLVKSLNLDPSMVPILQNNPDMVPSVVQAHQPDGMYKNWLIAKEDYVKKNSDPNDPQSIAKAGNDFEQKNPLINALTPSGGDPALNQLNAEKTNWSLTHPGQPLPDYYGTPEDLAAHKKQVADLTQAQTQNSASIGDLDQGLVKMRTDAETIAQNPKLDGLLAKLQANPTAANTARRSGWLASKLPGDFGMDQDEIDLLHKIDDLTTYNTKTFQAANPHLTARLGTIDSQLGTLQQFDSGAANWKKNIGGLVDAIDNTRANAAGAAGQLGRVLDAGDSDLEMKVDPSYLPGGRNYLGEPKQLSPSDLADAKKAIQDWDKEYPGQGRTRYIRHLQLQGYSPAGL